LYGHPVQRRRKNADRSLRITKLEGSDEVLMAGQSEGRRYSCLRRIANDPNTPNPRARGEIFEPDYDSYPLRYARFDMLRMLKQNRAREIIMCSFLHRLWTNEQGQDIAEYAVMLAVILVIVVGTIRLIGSNANTVFSQAASSIQ